MDNNIYFYNAKVISAYDADTITVDISLGFDFKFNKLKCRLYGIDAPEIRGEERPQGLIARDFLRNLILDKNVIIESIKDRKGKYGRYLVKVWLYQEDTNSYLSITDFLVKSGHAVYHDY